MLVVPHGFRLRWFSSFCYLGFQLSAALLLWISCFLFGCRSRRLYWLRSGGKSLCFLLFRSSSCVLLDDGDVALVRYLLLQIEHLVGDIEGGFVFYSTAWSPADLYLFPSLGAASLIRDKSMEGNSSDEELGVIKVWDHRRLNWYFFPPLNTCIKVLSCRKGSHIRSPSKGRSGLRKSTPSFLKLWNSMGEHGNALKVRGYLIMMAFYWI